MCVLAIKVESSFENDLIPKDVEPITNMRDDKAEKPSLYEYFGGLNPQVINISNNSFS